MKHLKNLAFLMMAFLIISCNKEEIFPENGTKEKPYEIESIDPNSFEERKIKFIYSEEGDTASIVVKDDGENMIYEGDIIVYELSSLELESISAPKAVGVKRFLRWSSGTIPYKIQNGHPYEANIRRAISDIESKTKVCFNEVDEGDFVFITFDPENNSSTLGDPPFGMDAIIKLNTGNMGTILHELLHTIGLLHEHSRSDRDNYVQINWENIEPRFVHNFRKRSWISAKDINDYDCGSIMHYSPLAFGIEKNGVRQTTIENVNCNVSFGQRNGLSPGDIDAINAMYYWATGCPQPLSKSIEDSTWYIEAKHSGKVLTHDGASGNNNIVQKDLVNHSSFQKFRFVPAGEDYYYIVDVRTRKVFTMVGQPADWKCAPGINPVKGNVILREKIMDNSCYQDAQKWKFIDLGNQTFQIVSKIVTNYKSFYLDIEGGSIDNNANLKIWHKGDQEHQKFILRPVPPKPVCNSQFVRQTVPNEIDRPGSINVSLTFKNTGNSTWNSNYKLVPLFQGYNAASPLNIDREVLPGEEYTFQFDVNFASNGNFKFKWMVEANFPCDGHFGQTSQLVEISVGGDLECSEIATQINNKKNELRGLQNLLQNASASQKAAILVLIRKVLGEIGAIENLANQNNC